MAVSVLQRVSAAEFAGRQPRYRRPTRAASAGPALLAAALGGLAATTDGLHIVGALFAVGLLCAFLLLDHKQPVLALLAVWMLQVFQAPLAATVGYASSAGHLVRECTDGLVVILLVSAVMRGRATVRGKQAQTIVLVVLAGVSLAGWTSAIAHQVPFGVALVGWWLAVKVWILLLISLRMPWKRTDADRVFRILMVVGALVSVLAVVDYLGHGAVASALGVNLTSTGPGAYRSTAVQAIFINPGECSLFLSYLVAVTFASYAERGRRTDLAMFALFALSTLLTLRLKGAVSVGAVVAVVIFIRSRERRSSTLALVCLACLAVVLVISVEGSVVTHQVSQISGPTSEGAVRDDLYRGGFEIGSQDFPFGVGFGRYASDTAWKHYSPVYYELGLNQVWGLSPTYPMFLDDTAWPSVIGESGYLGLAFVVAGFLWLGLQAVRVVRAGSADFHWWGVVAIAVLVVTLVNSIADPTLFDWLAVLTLASVFGPLIAHGLDIGPGELSRDLIGATSPSVATSPYRAMTTPNPDSGANASVRELTSAPMQSPETPRQGNRGPNEPAAERRSDSWLSLCRSDYEALFGQPAARSLRCAWRLLTNPSFQATVLLRSTISAPRYLRPVGRRLLLALHGMDAAWTGTKGPSIGPFLKLPHPTGIVIGEGVEIGARATIYHNVTLGQKHGQYPTLGDGVTLWPGAVVVGDVHVGDNAQVGALTFLDHDLPTGGVWPTPSMSEHDRKSDA